MNTCKIDPMVPAIRERLMDLCESKRIELGLSKTIFSKRLGISRRTYYQLIEMRHTPTLVNFRSICIGLGISADALLGIR